MAGQWHLDAETYLAMVRSEVPMYDELQDLIADATRGLAASAILDLGSGTGITAQRVVDIHPEASVTCVDANADMLRIARRTLPHATFVEALLEAPLPVGPFDLVVSAFAVHHLPSTAKADLFGRIAEALRPSGRFVLCDVVIPDCTVSTPVPLEAGVDLPDTAHDQRSWLEAAGFDTTFIFEAGDLAILQADRR